jgi:hypothetical protein
LWLFGGAGYDSAGNLGVLNDLWEFKPSLKQWAWIGGSSTLPTEGFEPGVYGNLGSPSSANIPGSRSEAVYWTDGSGKFWLFGGYLIDRFTFSDLWTFDPVAAEWTWMGGSSATPNLNDFGDAGVYGQLGVPGATNGPGALRDGSSWVDLEGNAWIYGGDTIDSAGTYGLLNDLWVYQPYPNAPSPSFSVAGGTYSTTQTVSLSDSTSGSSIYYTTDGTTPTIGSTQYTGPILVASTETVEAIAIADGYTASAVASATYTIPQSFTLAINPASVSVQAGQSGTSTITVQDEGGFNGNISFACSGLLAGDTCSFSTLTVPTQAGVSYTTLTVSTVASTAALHRNRSPLLPATVLAVAFLFGWRKRRSLLLVALLAVGTAGLSLLNGCGSGGSSSGGGSGGPQPVTTTVTVTASSGTLQQTTTFTLTVN